MTNKADHTERLEDYAVDVGKLKAVHQRLAAKRQEIEDVVAEEQRLGPTESLSPEARENIRQMVDRLLTEWEKELIATDQIATGSQALQRLVRQHFAIEQEILDAQDEQVEEATARPFEHPLR